MAAILSLGGRAQGSYNSLFAPFVFAGIGTVGRDSAGVHVVNSNWSYGDRCRALELALDRTVSEFDIRYLGAGHRHCRAVKRSTRRITRQNHDEAMS